MKSVQPLRFKTITEYFRFRGLPEPEHPLISVMKLKGGTEPAHTSGGLSLALDFYSIALKRMPGSKMKYGQQSYDFDEGVMFFMAPGQVFSIGVPKGKPDELTGWVLVVHPDFLWGSPLVQKIAGYEYFGYDVHEALHLSAKEEAVVNGLMQSIEDEYRSNIDKFSADVIIAQLELLLTYSERFYQRQFITRKKSAHQILDKLEVLLAAHFSEGALAKGGLPTVQSIATALHTSPGYLSGLLKSLTGQSTQQHIHDRLIRKAKEKRSSTGLSVSEIAYELGFEHPQSFSKLFKAKTRLSPLEFRASFN